VSKASMEEMKQARKERGIKPEVTAIRKRTTLVQKAIREAVGEGMMTVPEIAAASELPTQEVFWHINAMRKYGEAATVVDEEKESFLCYRLLPKDK